VGVRGSGRQQPGRAPPGGSWSPAHARWVPGSTLPVYQRQAFPRTCSAPTRRPR
jgi:hypothetical protein